MFVILGMVIINGRVLEGYGGNKIDNNNNDEGKHKRKHHDGK